MQKDSLLISSEIDTELAAEGIHETRRILIPNAVDTDSFYPLSPEDKHSLRQKLGLNSSRIAVFTGRLSPEKQVHILLSIWPEIRKSIPGALLLIVGDGSELEKLKNKARMVYSLQEQLQMSAPFYRPQMFLYCRLLQKDCL